MHPNCEAVNDILQAAGLPGRVQMLDEAVTTARAAAAYLGCPVGAIANSLIFATDGGTAAVDHDQWRASGRHDQSRRAARGRAAPCSS